MPATTRAALYAIPDPDGWYPAMLPGTGLVHGACHEVGAVDLAAVDAFEGADYTRAPVECALVPAQAHALAPRTKTHAYLWTAPLPGNAERIAHGDFARWLAETGYTAFAGD